MNDRRGPSPQPISPGMAEGYFWSILLMMSMPFLILGGLGGYFYLQVRAARAARPIINTSRQTPAFKR